MSAAACGCAQQPETVRGHEFYAMNNFATVVIHDDFSVRENSDKFDEFIVKAGQLINDIENSISATRTASCIYKVNQAQAGERVELNVHAYNVLSIAKSVYELTDGYYNPAVYYNVRSYGFNGGEPPQTEADLPTDDEIQAYKDLYAHFSELEIYSEDDSYYAIKPEYTVEFGGETLSMKLDLGGIGKGYATDCINELMDDYGYTQGYFNFGYSSIAFKKYRDGESYNLSFIDPRNIDKTYVRTTLKDVCVSSSGDYENYYLLNSESGETRYCHIINPTTGKPIETGVMSATVIGGSAAENDALTTAIMAMGRDLAIKFISESISNRNVIFTYDGGADGYFYYTNMADGDFEVVANNYVPLSGAENVA